MFLVGIFQWWYGAGLGRQLARARISLLRVVDYFSVGLLLKTLFNPWRQISAGQIQGPLPVQLRAFFDRLFSRVFGAIIRLVVMMIGLVAMAGWSVWLLVRLLVWLMVPLGPLIGIVLWQMGVKP